MFPLEKLNLSIVRILLIVWAFLTLYTAAASGQQDPTGLQIVSPVDGSVVAAGQPLTVTVAVTGGTAFTMVQVVGENLPDSTPLTSPPFTFSITTPNNVIGPKKLTAIGITGLNDVVFSPSITIDIEPTAGLVSLAVRPSMLQFKFAGQQFPLLVIGGFTDGNTLNIRRSSQTAYSSSDPAVATVDTSGLVTAIGQDTTDTTTILVQNNGQSVSIPVSVHKAIPGDLNADGVVNQDDINVLVDASRAGISPSGPFDARDLNHDGIIDQLDALVLVSLCTGSPCTIPVTATDTISPATTATASPLPNNNGWNNTNVTVTLSATDNPGGSGVKIVTYSLAGAQTSGSTVANSTTSFTTLAEGITTVTYNAVDNAENVEAGRTLSVRIDKTPPALTVPANFSVNATSPAGAAVTYTVSATDAVSGTPKIICSKASGGAFPIGTTTVTCTATDAADNISAAKSFAVTVLGAATQIQNLITKVQGLPIKSGYKNSLVTKLQAAQIALQAGNLVTACGWMNDFIQDVAGQSGKKLTVAQATDLQADGNRIKTVIGCR